MAFVFRSQPNKEKPKKTEDILLTNEKIEKNIIEAKINKSYENSNNNKKQNHNLNLAFSSSSKKEPSYYYQEKNPGPGSYDPRLTIQKTSLDDLDEDNENEDDKIFISKDKRFKPNDYENSLPGPGKYYKDLILSNQNNHLSPYKETGILYKKSRKYFVNSAKRMVTIPSKGTNFGYSFDDKGEIELSKDPQINNKFNGTKKNSVGPGYYSIENSYSKRNNALDWGKDNNKEDNSIKNNKDIYDSNYKSVQTEQNYINEYYKESPPYIISSLNSIIYSNNKESKKDIKIKNIIPKKNDDLFPNIPIKYSFDDKDLQKQKINEIKRSYIKESIAPGPGKYKLIDEFDIIANNKRNKNFGSNMNRGLLLYKNNNIIEIGANKNSLYKAFINSTEENIIKNNIFKENNIKLIRNNKINQEEVQNLIFQKVKGIKDQYINNKNAINSRRGPGIYNPQLYKKIFSKQIQHFGSLSQRFDLNHNLKKRYKSENLLSNTKTHKPKEIPHFKSQIPKNVLERNINGLSFSNIEKNKNNIINEIRKSPPVGYYSPEKNLSIEHEVKLLMEKNKGIPGFGEAEERFKNDNNDNEKLGVGYYNILPPEKKFTQRKIPFIFGIEKNGRGSILDNHLMKSKLGPGSYVIKDKNAWNKKSFNKLFS